MKKPIITGLKYNRLTIIKEVECNNPKLRKVLTKCDCGNDYIGIISTIKCGQVKSCGCLRKDKPNRFYHGLTKTTEHSCWVSLKMRCSNKNCKDYVNYGGRGITVCDRWLEPKGQGFINFINDMGKKPNPTYSLDRIDVNGNYEPSNCRWTDNKIQAKNKRPRVRKNKILHKSRLVVLPGTIFNNLTVIREIFSDKKYRMFELRCDCGNITEVSLDNLRKKNNSTKSCGCLKRKKKLDVQIGERFGNLTIIHLCDFDYTIHFSNRRRKVIVRCDCGTEKEVSYSNLKCNGQKSCGCLPKSETNMRDYRKIYETHFNVKIKDGNHIHHIDANRQNNHPDNLIEVNIEEHYWIHNNPRLIGITKNSLIKELDNRIKTI